MIPGRKLDELVAEHVYGWEWIDGCWALNHNLIYSHPELTGKLHLVSPIQAEEYRRAGEVKNYFGPPRVSTEISEAWQLLDYVTKRYSGGSVCLYVLDDGVKCTINRTGLYGDAVGETMPHAACLAVLKALNKL